MENINLEACKIFYFVAKYKSFTKTANILNISQPALSRRISTLESELNIKLFETGKTKKKTTNLTVRGKELYKLLDSIYFELKEFEEGIIEEENLQKGTINIGIRSHLAKFFLVEYIKEFLKLYPNISINIICKKTSTLVSMLKDKKIDFIIDTWPMEIENIDSVVVKNLAELSCIFVSREKHNDISKLEDFKKYNLIFPDEDSIPVHELYRICQNKNVTLKPILRMNSTELLLQCVKKNIGIGYVFKEVVQKYISNGRMYEIEIEEKLPKLKMNLVYINKNINKAAKAFLEDIINDIEEYD